MKIGIVGLGSIGSRHANNAAKLGHDARGYDPANGYSRFKFERDLYDWCDAAVIATPSHHHEAGLRACVERGKHVLIEKPISTSLGQLETLLDLAGKKDLVVMMGNNLRFHPCVKKVKEWLTRGLIGAPIWGIFICAQESSKPLYLSDGVVLNTGSHEVDLATHLIGPCSGVTAASMGNPNFFENAIANFIIEHRGLARSSFHLDFLAPIPVREFRIMGSEGEIYCDLIKRRALCEQPDPKLPGVVHEENYANCQTWDDDYVAELEGFIDLIEGKYTVPAASGWDGLDTLKVLLDVRKKAGL